MAGVFKRVLGLVTRRIDQPIIPEFHDEPGRGYRGPSPAAAVAKAPACVEPHLILHAPTTGRVLALSQVGDPTFAEGHFGLGMGIETVSGPVLAPITGTLTHWFPSFHAAVITTPGGLDILIHVGAGDGALLEGSCTPGVEAGSAIAAGQPLIHLDEASLAAYRNDHERRGIPVVVTVQGTKDGGYILRPLAGKLRVEAGEELFSLEPENPPNPPEG